jgi:hypothetical protein
MNEEVDEIKTQDTTQQKPEVKLVPVRNSLSSGTRIVARGGNGRFAKARRKLDNDLKTTERVERDIRALLIGPAKDEEGNVIKDANGKPVPLHIKVAEHLLSVALKLDDPKALGGAAKMLESIMARGLGKVSDSAVTRDALQNSRVRVVILTPPAGLPVVHEDKPKELLKSPSWAKAEVVKENEATNVDKIEE